MKKIRRTISAKISTITAIIIIIGVLIIVSVLFFSLQNLADKTAHKEMEEISRRYSNVVNETFSYPSNFVRIVSTEINHIINTQNGNREDFQKRIFAMFEEYPYIDATAIMLEPNVFDGKDADYINTQYGTANNGLLSYYYAKEDGSSKYMIGVEENEKEYEQAYYTVPKAEKKIILSEPYVYTISGTDYSMITISAPVLNDEKDVMGVVTADIFLSSLFEEMINQKIYSTGYLVLTSNKGIVIYSPNKEDLGKTKESVGLDYPISQNEKINFSYANSTVNGKKSLVSTVPINLSYIDQDCYLSIVAPVSEINKEVNDLIYVIGFLFLIVTIVGIFITYIFVKRLLNPLNSLADSSEKISNGNFQIQLPKTSNDEIGLLSNSFDTMVNTINTLIMDIQLLSEEHSQGEIDFRLDEYKYSGAYGQVVQNANKMVGSYALMIKDITEATENFANGNFDISVKEYPGQFLKLSQSTNGLKENLLSIKKEITMLVDSGSEGKLSSRADSDRFEGDWRELLKGLNEILENVIAPINEIQNIAKELSQGNFNISVDGNYKGDFATLKDSFNLTITAIHSYIEEISSTLLKIAKGDLTPTIDREYLGQFKLIKDSIESILESLNKTLDEIINASSQILLGSNQIANSSMTLAQGATNQANAIEQLTNSINLINQQTKITDENSNNANKLSISSSDNAKAGNIEMSNMLQSMDGIKDSSSNISNIIKVIEDIAFQTNLLALNAAVEAARAGTHGKGFAVVAEEVRSLASRSQEAAKTTTELIHDSISKVNEGTENANATAKALNTIVEDTNQVSEIISGIALSASEQMKAISDVSASLVQISEVVQINAATSEETASASEELNSQVEMLKQLISYFELK